MPIATYLPAPLEDRCAEICDRDAGSPRPGLATSAVLSGGCARSYLLPGLVGAPPGRPAPGLLPRLVFLTFFGVQQKAMAVTACIVVGPHDVPASVDPEAGGGVTAGEVNRRELAVAQQKAMLTVVVKTTWLGSTVIAHDIATEVDPSFSPKGCGVNSTWEVNRCEMALAE